ncbi:MobF family relaxase [Variovorax sp. M-6]|uniref:MobF family relaxase n=1 Tax=Variovorax sp. M-6 TaxID=3233041 RepID=UPI003F99A0C8
MLNVTSIRGNNQYAAAHYFSSGDDYYAKEHPGQWQGEGARLLGLIGPVDQAQLSRLFNGQLPNGDVIQTTFDPAHKKRMGLDLTFSAPKSVSMQALVAGDTEVTDAHDRAVTRALERVERLAVARKKVKGKSSRERTSNMVIGKFRHELSRAKDPQLHTHAVVLNMTRRADGAWRSLSNEEIYRVQHEIDALYKAELAKGLRELGYAIRVLDGKGNFELAHINRDQIAAFSARANVIEEALANDGKTRATATALEKQIISLATRPRKDESDRELIKQYWAEKSRVLGIDYGERSRLDGRTYGPVSGGSPSQGSTGHHDGGSGDSGSGSASVTSDLPAGILPAAEAVGFAIKHLAEREAIMVDSDLKATALARGVNHGVGSDEINAQIKRLVERGALIEAPARYRSVNQSDNRELTAAGWQLYGRKKKGWSEKDARKYVEHAIQRGFLVRTQKRYTTIKLLKLERAVLAIERAGRGQVAPILDIAVLKHALDGSKLNGGQRAAVEMILGTSNRFVGIQGDAGTGKTYTVNRAVALLQKASTVMRTEGSSEGRDARPQYRIVALAPYGNQVKALKEEGLEAHTLASFLHTKEKPIDARTLIVLDEAGVVGVRQMAQVMRIVEKAGARMVLLGDTKQTEAIEAGKPFAQLQQEGMPTARIHEIQRQKDPELKKAVEHAAEGRSSLSLSHLAHVEEVKDATLRRHAIASDYLSLAPEDRRGTLIVAGTNEARRDLIEMVREGLDLVGKGRDVEILTRVDMTQAQRRYAPSYQPGMVIQPERPYPLKGLAKGELYRVKEALPNNKLMLQRTDGTEVTISPRQITKLSVYHLETVELSVGDTIRINRNDSSFDLTNGDRMRVAGMVGKLVQLETVAQNEYGRPVRRLELLADKPLHLEHAYASTVHSSQGLTSDRALIDLDTNSRTTSMNLYYVAVSRPRHEARVYTNSVEALPVAIARQFDKTTALEIQRERQMERVGKIKLRLATGSADGMKLQVTRRGAPADGAGLAGRV